MRKVIGINTIFNVKVQNTYTRRVLVYATYARFGGNCNNGFIDGLSAVNQNNATSNKNWNNGS